MARRLEPPVKRSRLSIDIHPELHRRLRLAAAKSDRTIGEHVLEAIEDRFRRDLPAEPKIEWALTSAADPVLAELWDNPNDAAYDRL